MSCFNDDRSTFNDNASGLDAELSTTGFDDALCKAFQNGMELDEISYIVNTHTERIIRRQIVQHQLKKAANKEK